MPVSSDLSNVLRSSVTTPTHVAGSVEVLTEQASMTPASEPADVIVAGSLAIDMSCDYTPFTNQKDAILPSTQTSNPATIEQSLGGVGFNVAIAASYSGSKTLFCSVVADDLSGRAAIAAVKHEGLDTAGIKILSASKGFRTAQYIAINDARKGLYVAMADMGIFERTMEELDAGATWKSLVMQVRPAWIVVDGNWSPTSIEEWIELGRESGSRIAFEPVSTAKATRVFAQPSDGKTTLPVIGPSNTFPHHKFNLAAPNELELQSMYFTARENGLFDSPEWWAVINELNLSSAGSRDLLVSVTTLALVDAGIPQQSIQLLPYIPCLLIKLGSQGVLLTQLLQRGDVRLSSPDSAPYIVSRSVPSTVPNANGNLVDSDMVGGVYMRLFPPETVLTGDDVISVNGAGDTLLGVTVAGLARGKATDTRIEDVIPLAQKAAFCTLQSKGGVSPKIRELNQMQ